MVRPKPPCTPRFSRSRPVAELPADWTALPYGTPLPNNACRVVNDIGDDCPDWVVGELWVSGRGIARGYRGRPDLTAERFVVHDGRTWYRTGDLARYWPDGTLRIRRTRRPPCQISGYRVELGEVEAALRQVAGVAIAVAAMVPTPGGADMLAAAVRADDTQLTADQACARRDDRTCSRAMIPRHVSLVEHIPFTARRQDRPARRRRASWPPPSPSLAEPGHRAPSTPLESALAAIVGRRARGGVGRR